MKIYRESATFCRFDGVESEGDSMVHMYAPKEKTKIITTSLALESHCAGVPESSLWIIAFICNLLQERNETENGASLLGQK